MDATILTFTQDWTPIEMVVKAGLADEHQVEAWRRAMLQAAAARLFVNEHPDGGWFAGTWDRHAAQWVRPLDAESKRLTGCHSEFSRHPFSAIRERETAIGHALELYGDWLREELGRFWDASDAADRFDVAPSSVTWACREGQIVGARKDGGEWSFPLIAFVDWLENRPGRGGRA